MRNFLRRTRDADMHLPTHRATTDTPRWVRVIVIIFIILVLLVVLLHLTGNGFGPHMHMPAGEHGVQLL